MDLALRMTAGYLTSRKQFGVTSTTSSRSPSPLTLYIALELTRAWSAGHDGRGRGARGTGRGQHRAAFQVAKAGRLIGHESIQLHGGTGMTAEYAIGAHTAHLFTLEQWLGTGGHHLSAPAATVADHGEVEPIR